MKITVVQPAWRVCPGHLKKQDSKKNSFRPLTDDEHMRGLENRERVLETLRDRFGSTGLNILLHGSQVYNPQQGEDFDLIALYTSRASLRGIASFRRLEEAPGPVLRVLRAVLRGEPSQVLDFLESEFASFRFKFQINGSAVSLNVFYQPVFKRVAEGGFFQGYKKIRIAHPEGPILYKRAALFDGTPLWIPSSTSNKKFNGEDYWLREYYGWLFEIGSRAFSGLIKTSIGHLVTSEIILQENEGVAQLVEKAEKAFAAALAAFSRERGIEADPCDAFIRVNRFRPEYKEQLRKRIGRHVPTERDIERYELSPETDLCLGGP